MANTPNLGLHQWAATDSFLREEFNEDFGKIDAAVKAALPVVGSYLGNGISGRKISLGFHPSVIFFLCQYAGSTPTVCILTETRYTIIWGTQGTIVRHSEITGASNETLFLTEDGFQMGDAVYFNKQGEKQVYIAFH